MSSRRSHAEEITFRRVPCVCIFSRLAETTVRVPSLLQKFPKRERGPPRRDMGKGCIIESISLWERARIHALSFVYGVWVVCKRLLRRAWAPCGSAGRPSLPRDNPPSCLVDSTLGRHNYVKIKGTKFHYVESGPVDAPLLLLLHGFPDCWLSWRHQIPVLARHFRVVSLDLKGFGDSDKPPWRSGYRIDAILDELRLFVLTLGATSCRLIGHDLGALLGWYLVHREPDLVTEFYAVSCPHPNVYWQSLSKKKQYRWLNFVQVPYLPELDAMKQDACVIDEYHRHLEPNNVYLEAYKYSFSRQQDWTGPINYYRDLPLRRINDDCDRIRPTVVLITGAGDRLVGLEGIVKSTEYCEKFHMKIIEDADHFPHQENPDSFNKVLLKYLVAAGDVRPTAKGVGRSPSKRLVEGLLGAVTNTVRYGNSVIDNVHKRTNIMNGLPALGLPFTYNQTET